MSAQTKEKSSSEAVLTKEQDYRWKRYVSTLSPYDDQAAFLLPEELPKSSSSPEAIEEAIMRATQRAFFTRTIDIGEKLTWWQRLMRWLIGSIPSTRRFEVKDYQLGLIRGELSVLLPQGKEIKVRFNDELGWKARIVVGDEPDQQEMSMYYKESCMNPARVLARKEGEIDTSKVEFRPLGKGQVEEILNNREVDLITRWNARRLSAEYELLTTHGKNPGD